MPATNVTLELSVFELFQNLRLYWKWKRECHEWKFLNKYVNNNFFQFYTKWQQHILFQILTWCIIKSKLEINLFFLLIKIIKKII